MRVRVRVGVGARSFGCKEGGWRDGKPEEVHLLQAVLGSWVDTAYPACMHVA